MGETFEVRRIWRWQMPRYLREGWSVYWWEGRPLSWLRPHATLCGVAGAVVIAQGELDGQGQ